MTSKDIGILALDIYFPSNYVDQDALEKYDGVSQGKYTIGLGQEKMAFCSDREDTVSICLSVVRSLLNKYKVSPKEIGRLEVGTESMIDKSKSIKSFLMEFFVSEGNYDVEGVDNINACYGGTAALLNSCAWIESSSWDGRYALVVAADIAVYEKGNARPSGGAGAVAMLVGPSAPLVLEPGLRSSYFDSVYDFYKPNLSSEYPTVDGALSQKCFTQSLDNCWDGLKTKYEKKGLGELNIDGFAYYCFHSPYNKLVRKSFSRLIFKDFQANPKSEKYSSLDQNLALIDKEQSYERYEELSKIFVAFGKNLYDEKVKPSEFVGRNIGNMYTASVFGSLISLVSNTKDEDLVGKRIAMFSYGSGLASSLYSIKINSSLDNIRSNINLLQRLSQRTAATPENFSHALELRSKSHGQSNYTPSGSIDSIASGAYYLESVDSQYRRQYKQKP
eukprot:c13188_g1_i1.p1 GENE.c13188_g1_i1~~c13188_g1_i1.p1  ORF type:complete len:447 (-),score=160.14 c13188_g1_i1:27-1367(-)